MDAQDATGAFRSYCERHGLIHFNDWGVPEATQLLRHGFAQRVPNLGMGDLPGGIEDGWLAQASFATIAATDVRQHEFTVVIARVPESIGFATRVVCHDRGLSDEERSNPDADAEVIELADRDLNFESEAFFERYTVSTDHDQDNLRAWQLFSPALIHWLTDEAPPGFSFELQDGALCCFVPGFRADEDDLDALCTAAARINRRVLELDGTATTPTYRTRATIIDDELAAHPFDRPPKSVWAAARAFGIWGLISGRSWRLGAEAFFRSYAAEAGFKRVDEAVFRASHIDTPFPGEITQAAAGHVEPERTPAWLLLTNHESGGFGWTVLVVDPREYDRLYRSWELEETKTAEADGFHIVTDARSLIVFRPDAKPNSRTRAKLDQFMAVARDVAGATVVAAKPEQP